MRVRLTHVLLILVILAAAPTAFAGERAQQNYLRRDWISDRQRRLLEVLPRGGTSVRPPPPGADEFEGSPSSSSSAVMQIGPNGVETLNLLEEGLLPYTTMNGSTFPAPTRALTKATPSPNDAEYTRRSFSSSRKTPRIAGRACWSTRQDVLDHRPTRTPSRTAARPACCRCSTCRSGVRRPRSRRDLKNNDFVYLRFQRGSCITTMAASAPRGCCWATT